MGSARQRERVCIRYSMVVRSIGTPDIPKMAPKHRDCGAHSDYSMARELPSLTGILISSGCKRSKGTHKAIAEGQLGKTNLHYLSKRESVRHCGFIRRHVLYGVLVI